MSLHWFWLEIRGNVRRLRGYAPHVLAHRRGTDDHRAGLHTYSPDRKDALVGSAS
jgi:hypothetical protein